MVFFLVCQFSHVLRDLAPNAFVADHAHQQVHLLVFRLSRGAALRRNQSFYSWNVETFVANTLSPSDAAGFKAHCSICLLQQNGRQCCPMGFYCSLDFVQLFEANQAIHGQCPEYGAKPYSEAHY